MNKKIIKSFYPEGNIFARFIISDYNNIDQFDFFDREGKNISNRDFIKVVSTESGWNLVCYGELMFDQRRIREVGWKLTLEHCQSRLLSSLPTSTPGIPFMRDIQNLDSYRVTGFPPSSNISNSFDNPF